MSILLKNGRVLRAGSKKPERMDIAIGDDGCIVALAPTLPPEITGRAIELNSRLVVPGLVDAHQHLDKSRTRQLIANPMGTLEGASAGYRAFAATTNPTEIMARAERTLDACLAQGTVAIRSHTNIESESGLRGIESMIDLRERCCQRMTLQIVAHLTGDAPRKLSAAQQWLKEAITLGADAIGGVPQYADQPLTFIDLLFDHAERSGLPLDMHIDEHLDPERILFDAIIERTRAHGMQGRVVAGHCCALSAIEQDEAKRIIEGFAEAEIGVVTLPAANLFLQGRDTSRLPPRGLTRVMEFIEGGVRLAAASDNIQDPFIPIGSGDLLEIARWTLLAGHFGLRDLDTAFEMISATPAHLIGLENWGIEVGNRADLLVADAEDLGDLVASGPRSRLVLVAGRVVAGQL